MPINKLVTVDDQEVDFIRDTHLNAWSAKLYRAENPEAALALDLGEGISAKQASGEVSIVILLDLMFEKGDWHEGLSHLRAIRTGKTSIHQRTPVVVLSAADKRDECICAGANDFLQRTSPREKIRSRIQYFLGQQTIQREFTTTVQDLDLSHREAIVRIHDSESDTFIIRTMDLARVPSEARLPGAVFKLTSSTRFVHFEDESVLRASPWESEEDERAIAEIFREVGEG